MKVAHFLKRGFNSRIVFLFVFVSLLFIAHELARLPYDGHGVASCVAPKVEAEVIVCYFPPPPPVWKLVIAFSNVPPLFASEVISESVENLFPQLCGFMTFINLSSLVAGIFLQWVIVGLGVDYLIARIKTAYLR